MIIFGHRLGIFNDLKILTHNNIFELFGLKSKYVKIFGIADSTVI
jgi:hypothetical protein